MIVDRIDHVVFTVQDIAATCAFYKAAVGAETVTFGAESEKLTVREPLAKPWKSTSVAWAWAAPRTRQAARQR